MTSRMDELARTAREQLNGKLPEGYKLHRRGDGWWVGETPHGGVVVKSPSHRFVEDVLFRYALAAAGATS